ncbi:MAG TPA: hypothetical protein VK324_18115 [Tepidisphaeraceae bacterium]|nr:hypothetical protein [Tepidisphaeraceae bacterium]
MTVDFLGALASQAALAAAVLGLLVWLAPEPWLSTLSPRAGDLVRRVVDSCNRPSQQSVLARAPASYGQALAGLVRPVDLLLSTARPSRAPPTATDRVRLDLVADRLAGPASSSAAR